MAVLKSYKMPDWVRGDTYDGAQITFTDDDTGAPIDLTGCTVLIGFRLLNKLGELGIVLATVGAPIVSGATMVYALTIASNVLTINPFDADMLAGTWVFDVQVRFPSGRVKTYYEGTWTLEPDVTPDEF